MSTQGGTKRLLKQTGKIPLQLWGQFLTDDLAVAQNNNIVIHSLCDTTNFTTRALTQGGTDFTTCSKSL
jgi:hypothetical protein